MTRDLVFEWSYRLSQSLLASLLLLVVVALTTVQANGWLAYHRPDVFLITIDTLRADHLHCLGDNHINTPNLDGIGKDGVVFRQAFTASPITTTSHASILTGLLPSVHGVSGFRVSLSPVHPTIARVLKEQGYETAAFIGSMVLDTNTMAPGFDQGFDFYDGFPADSSTGPSDKDVRRSGKDVIRDTENWLNRHRSGGPRFVWVHLYDVHSPYYPPQPYSQMYGSGSYDGAVAYADSIVGDYVEYLKRRDWYRNALIIVVADHGEGLGEHGEDMHGIFLYGSTIHVPLIIKLPKNEEGGATIDAQVRTIDIFPTVLQVLGIDSPAKLSGESLVPYWSGGVEQKRPVIAETDYPLTFDWAPLRAVQSDGFKFIEAPRPELYDLRDDPNEVHNIYKPWDPHVLTLRRILAEAERMPSAADNPRATVKASTVRELEALGYLTPADALTSTNVNAPSLLPDAKDKVEELRLLQRAGAALGAGRNSEGRQYLEQALQMNPASPSLLSRLVGLELQAGERDKGEEYLQLSAAIRDKDASAAYRVGGARQKLGDAEGAREALEVSLSLASNRLATHLLLGSVLSTLKQTKDAEIQFRSALVLDPTSADARTGLARCEIAQGDFRDAVQQLQALVASGNADTAVFRLLFDAYSGTGQEGAAATALERARQLTDGGPPASARSK